MKYQSHTWKGYDKSYSYKMLVLFAVLAAFVMYIDIMLAPSLPSISSQYHINSAQASLIISLYLVFGTAIIPIIGKLGDMFGKKRILIYVLIAYVSMVGVTSFASSYHILLISRMFQGIGLSIFPLAFSLVREEFPRELVPRAQGLIAGMFGAGLSIGLVGGAYIANYFGWQANYHIGFPFIIGLTILIYLIGRESRYRDPNVKLDYLGAAWLGISLAAIVLGLSEGETWGWTSLAIVGLIVGGMLAIIPLAFVEKHRTQPILNIKLLKHRNVLISNIMILATGVSMFLVFQAISYKMELPAPGGFGYDILTTGLYLLPMAVTILVLAYPLGILLSRFGIKRFLMLGALVGALGFLLMPTATTALGLAEYLILAAVGIAILQVAIQNLLVLSVDPHEMGLATSLNTVFRNMGSGMGAPIAGSLISTFTATYIIHGIPTALPLAKAFNYSFYAGAAAFLVIFVLAFFAEEVLGKRAVKRAY
jgi:MFS family permease